VAWYRFRFLENEDPKTLSLSLDMKGGKGLLLTVAGQRWIFTIFPTWEDTQIRLSFPV
jgi:hypothetical protein